MRSYTKEQIINNLQNGNSVYFLDTNGYGEDDYLVGSFGECLYDALEYHNLKELPDDWDLCEVTEDEFLQSL
jgi:hypothetical protein